MAGQIASDGSLTCLKAPLPRPSIVGELAFGCDRPMPVVRS